MDMSLIHQKFGRMGARVQLGPLIRNPWNVQRTDSGITLNIHRDRRGEYFDIRLDPARVEVDVIDVRPEQRHLLLMARLAARKDKFLCGHDERSWFVAAVPNAGGVSNVLTAMEALKPAGVQAEQARRGVAFRDRTRRRTAAYIRQGEWFFVPAPDIHVDNRLVFTNEPLRRGNGKPHMCQYLLRQGGVTVYWNEQHPNGLPEAEYRDLLRRQPEAGKWRWRVMRADAGVFVKGAIRHPDHKTVVLAGWHLVLMNTETEAPSMQHVRFLD